MVCLEGSRWGPVYREALEFECGHVTFGESSWIWNSRVRSQSCAIMGVLNTQLKARRQNGVLGSAGAEGVKAPVGVLSLRVEGRGNPRRLCSAEAGGGADPGVKSSQVFHCPLASSTRPRARKSLRPRTVSSGASQILPTN